MKVTLSNKKEHQNLKVKSVKVIYPNSVNQILIIQISLSLRFLRLIG